MAKQPLYPHVPKSRIKKAPVWECDATPAQKKAIGELRAALRSLGVEGFEKPIEYQPMDLGSAGKLVRQLSDRLAYERSIPEGLTRSHRPCYDMNTL